MDFVLEDPIAVILILVEVNISVRIRCRGERCRLWHVTLCISLSVHMGDPNRTALVGARCRWHRRLNVRLTGVSRWCWEPGGKIDRVQSLAFILAETINQELSDGSHNPDDPLHH